MTGQPALEALVDNATLPAGWRMSTIGELLKVRNGFAFKSKDYQDEGVLLVRQSNLGGSRVTTEKAKYLPSEYLEKHKDFLVQKGDILIWMSGSIGKLCTYDLQEPALQNQRTGLLVFKDEEQKPWVWHYLPLLEKSLLEVGKGVAVQNVSAKQIESFPIPVAPIDQQKRIIAEIEKQFSRLDEAVTNLKRAKANLKRYKAAVLKAAVDGKLTEEWRKAHPDVEPASKLLDRILAERRAKWEEAELAKMKAKGKAPKNDKWKAKYKEPAEPDISTLPELPEGWVWSSLQMISDAVGGYAFSSKLFTSSGYQVVKMANVRMGYIDLTQRPSFVSELGDDVWEKYGLVDGDVLITLTGTRRERDYGYVAVVRGSQCLLLNQRIARLRAEAGVAPEYLALSLQGESYRNRFFARETGNVGQGNVGMAAVTIEAVPLAPQLEQLRIVAEVDESLSVLRKTEAQVEVNFQRAMRLRQALLAKAFRGELDASASQTTGSDALEGRCIPWRVREPNRA